VYLRASVLPASSSKVRRLTMVWRMANSHASE